MRGTITSREAVATAFNYVEKEIANGVVPTRAITNVASKHGIDAEKLRTLYTERVTA